MADNSGVVGGAAQGATVGSVGGPVGAIGGAVLGGALSWMNSESARKASAAEREKMAQIINNLQDPSFDPNMLTPEQYAVAAKYTPEMAAYIEEVKPTIIQETQDMVQGRSAQRDALERLSGIGKSTDVDPQMQALANAASRKAQTEAQSRQASILQDAERRGASNNGVTLAAQLSGSADAMDRLANTQNQNAGDSYRQRLQALAQSGELGGQMRQQDASLQGKNADIINSFNARNASNRQNYANQQAGLINDANKFNTGVSNQTNNANVDIRNRGTQSNQARADEISRSQYNAGLNKANLQIGQGGQQIAAINQNAADRNQAIQGVVGAYGAYQGTQSAAEAEKMRQDRMDNRARYQQTGNDDYLNYGGGE